MRILIVGGYGTFGGRLARLLADETRLTLLIAGRSQRQAEIFCAAHRAKATMQPCVFDRARNIQEQLQALSPDIVVDAAGPFQTYGDDPYALVREALTCGAHYLDLADGSDFVHGISQFDALAQAKNLFVLSGVSSFPVLSAAVVRALLKPGDIPERIEAGLAPSPHADIGLNVMRAIASYAGKAVRITRNGRIEKAHALIDSRVISIATPGRLPIGIRRFSLVDVPDLQMLRDVWPTLGDVWVGAAMKPALLQRVLNGAAMAVRVKLLPSLEIFAPIMLRARNLFASGEHRGGMIVRVTGRDSDNEPFARSWHMTADGEHGPFIPSMPAAVIVLRCIKGEKPPAGARAAMSELELADYEPLFRDHDIAHGIRVEGRNPVAPLYRRVLQSAYADLSPALQAMHDRTVNKSASGRADIDRGNNPLARFAAAIIGFPPAGHDVPVTVNFVLRDGREIWQRDFGGHKFRSVQSEGSGRSLGLVDERFGPAVFGLGYETGAGRSDITLRNWRLLGIPMPLWLAPVSRTFEFEQNGKFHFHVEISHPLTGLIVRYRGWLEGSQGPGPN